MTVSSTNYSSLEEAWGESFSSSTSRPKKEKRKKVVDPICELYEMGNNNGYTDNDLVSYANTYVEKHDKSRYQRAMEEDQDVLPHRPRERPVRHVDILPHQMDYDVTDNEDEPYYTEKRPHVVAPQQLKKEQPRPSRNYKRTVVIDDDEERSDPSSFAFIDLLLYIVSGIILIFVLEQFVKIGLLLQ